MATASNSAAMMGRSVQTHDGVRLGDPTSEPEVTLWDEPADKPDSVLTVDR